MDDPYRYENRPFTFMFRYIRLRRTAHAIIIAAVLAAVLCSVATQYGVKYLVDVLSGPMAADKVWFAFLFLVSLIGADNLLWRLASWVASFTFVGVTGDVRRDLFRHLTGHSPTYFANRMPGHFDEPRHGDIQCRLYRRKYVRLECVAALRSNGGGHRAHDNDQRADGGRAGDRLAGIMVVAMFRMAAAGRPLHHDFADKAAAIDGEMVDVISNLPIVNAFCGSRPRASPVRCDRRSRDDRQAAQPAVFGTVADIARGWSRSC